FRSHSRSCATVISVSDINPPRYREKGTFLHAVGERLLLVSTTQRALDVRGLAGPTRDLSAGRAGNGPGRDEQHVSCGDTVASRDRGPYRIGDRLRIGLARTGCTLGDDHELLGRVVGIEF